MFLKKNKILNFYYINTNIYKSNYNFIYSNKFHTNIILSVDNSSSKLNTKNINEDISISDAESLALKEGLEELKNNITELHNEDIKGEVDILTEYVKNNPTDLSTLEECLPNFISKSEIDLVDKDVKISEVIKELGPILERCKKASGYVLSCLQGLKFTDVYNKVKLDTSPIEVKEKVENVITKMLNDFGDMTFKEA